MRLTSLRMLGPIRNPRDTSFGGGADVLKLRRRSRVPRSKIQRRPGGRLHLRGRSKEVSGELLLV